MSDLKLVIYDDDVVDGSEEQKALKAGLSLGEFVWMGVRYMAIEHKRTNLISIFGYPRYKTIIKAMKCIPLPIEESR